MSDPRATLADIAAQCSGALPLPPGAAELAVPGAAMEEAAE